MKIIRTTTIVFLILFGVTSFAQDSLRLEKIIIVSRHGLRAPLEKNFATLDSLVDTCNSYKDKWKLWEKKGVKGSELTPKGVELENYFGKFFRLWFDSIGFQLHADELYFGASSKQRTVATANSFASGLMPHMTIPVHFRHTNEGGYGFYDVNYLPLLYDEGFKEGVVFDTNQFHTEAYREIELLKEEPSYEFLEDVLGYSKSPRAQTKGCQHFITDSVQLYFYERKNGKIVKRLEPTMYGDLKVANMASDALILMYYEFPDTLRSFFKRDFSFDDMCKLASVKDQYGRKLFTAPIVAVNVSHCMLKNIYAEMNCNWHKFTFLCTHDSMIQSLLTALRVEDYELKNTIEKDTPIGVKLVLEKWVDPNVDDSVKIDSSECVRYKRYIKARLYYQSTEQVQEMQVLNLKNPPQFCELSFTGLEKEENGMYDYDAFMKHIEKTLDAYKLTAIGKNPFDNNQR